MKEVKRHPRANRVRTLTGAVVVAENTNQNSHACALRCIARTTIALRLSGDPITLTIQIKEHSAVLLNSPDVLHIQPQPSQVRRDAPVPRLWPDAHQVGCY